MITENVHLPMKDISINREDQIIQITASTGINITQSAGRRVITLHGEPLGLIIFLLPGWPYFRFVARLVPLYLKIIFSLVINS